MSGVDLTQSPHVGVRWQAEMEELLALARERVTVAGRIPASSDPDGANRQAHAAIAQAAASAALALAVANTGSDVEMALDKIAEKIGRLR